MELNIIKVVYEDLNETARFAESLRGYLGNKYIDNTLVHNHDGSKYIYRYPLVQYKVINKKPMIIGINEGVDIVSNISMRDDEFLIEDEIVNTYQKDIKIYKENFGITDDYIEYEFKTPWIALNQRNSKVYKEENNIGKEELLKRTLIGNILSLSKGLEYSVLDEIICWISLEEKIVTMKNVKHIGFVGRFKTNFQIPDFLGIGKSVSRGFGVVKAVR